MQEKLFEGTIYEKINFLDDENIYKRYSFIIKVFWDKFNLEGITDVKFFKGVVEENKFILK
jgi:hypothetical protein